MTVENCQPKTADDFGNYQPKGKTMKTLDEVIKAWSICFSDNSRSDCAGCPYADEDGDAACFNHDREDALHYLKEYRDYAKAVDERYADLEKKHIMFVNAMADFEASSMCFQCDIFDKCQEENRDYCEKEEMTDEDD